MHTLTDEQSNALMYYIRTDQTSYRRWHQRHRDYLLASLMLDAGLRINEVHRLKASHLYDHGHPVVTLDIPQCWNHGGSTRYIPVAYRLTAAIQQYFDTVGTLPAFFLTPVSVRQIRRIIAQAGKAALNIHVNPHMLRHTFATRLMRTSSIRVVQELLGHKSLRSTQIYTHPDAQDLRKAIDTLNPPTLPAEA